MVWLSYLWTICLWLSQTNTYQGILVTDGTRSYAIVTFRCGDRSINLGGYTVTGFSTPDTSFQLGYYNAYSYACYYYYGDYQRRPDGNVLFEIGYISKLKLNNESTSFLCSFINFGFHWLVNSFSVWVNLIISNVYIHKVTNIPLFTQPQYFVVFQTEYFL